MRPHRIALVSSSYHPYPGGVEEHTAQVAREFQAREIPVEVWAVDRGEHLGVQRVDGVTVRYLPTPLPSFSPTGILRFLGAMPGAATAWAQAFRRFHPSLLHVHCFGPNGVYSLVSSTLTRRPLVVSSHGETTGDENDVFGESRLLRVTLRLALRRAVATTGCSETVLDDLRARFGLVEGVVVPNGVTLPADLPPLEGARSPIVFAVGRQVRVKGFDLLLAAFAKADTTQDARLVLGGDGPEHDALARQAKDLGVADRVDLPGRLSPDEVANWMARAQVVAVPSRREAFGIVLLEAWRGGAAILATSHDGPGTIIRDGVDGAIADPDDTDAFAKALAGLLADKETRLRLADAGRQRVRKYRWATVADRYLSLYPR